MFRTVSVSFEFRNSGSRKCRTELVRCVYPGTDKVVANTRAMPLTYVNSAIFLEKYCDLYSYTIRTKRTAYSWLLAK